MSGEAWGRSPKTRAAGEEDPQPTHHVKHPIAKMGCFATMLKQGIDVMHYKSLEVWECSVVGVEYYFFSRGS